MTRANTCGEGGGTKVPAVHGVSTGGRASKSACRLFYAAAIALGSWLLTACGGGGNANPPPQEILVSVSPSTATIFTTQSVQFRATVTGTSDARVAWSVNDVPGGNAANGSISATGLYTAPAIPPSPNAVAVKAASIADSSRTDSAQVTIENPAPQLSSISPSAVDAGSGDANLAVLGSNFGSQSEIRIDNNPLATTFVDSSQLIAAVPAGQLEDAGTLLVQVVTPGPGGGTSGSANLKVQVVMTISPTSAILKPGQTQQFSPTVIGNSSQGVSWSVNGILGGNTTLGTIDSAGLYIGPSIPPSSNLVTVTATSLFDPTRSASATLTIENPIPALSSILPATVEAGGPDLVLTVTGSDFTPQSAVNLDGKPLPTTFAGPTQLSATVPASQTVNAGSLEVMVVNPSPGGGTSASAILTVLIAVTISPSTQTLNAGQSLQFTANVAGTANNSLIWSVNDIPGGDASLGTVTSTGLFTAPAVPPSPNTVVIRAVSVADSSRSDTASITLVNPAPQVSSVSPSVIDAGSPDTTINVQGSGFSPQSIVLLGSTSLSTTFVDSSYLTAVTPSTLLANAASLQVTVITPAPGGGSSNAISLAVVVVVTINPSAPTVIVTRTQQFTNTVVGTTDTTVIWSVNNVAGGNSLLGTISTSGLFSAPQAPPSPNTVTIKATSVADPSRSASTITTIVNPVPVLSSITPLTIDAGSSGTTLGILGSGFATQSVARATGIPLATSFVSSSGLNATLPAAMLAAAGTLSIDVSTPSPGGGTSSSVDFQVLVVVQVSSANTSVLTGQTQQLTATVIGTADQTVTWSIDGVGAGNSTAGTISSNGLYSAPATVPNPPMVIVRATSGADTQRSGATTLTIASPVEDWPKFRRDLANTGRSAEAGLSSANVGLLKKKWAFQTGGKISASPAVATVGGVRTVYIGSWNGNFYAVRADTGTERWHFAIDPVVGCTLNNPSRIGSSAAVENGLVYFGAVNGFVYALDAVTGGLIWKVQLGDPCQGTEIWSSPALFNGVVYVGVASHNAAPCVVGRVVALDANSGTSVWSFDTIDQSTCPSGTCLGAGVWGSPAIDTQFGILYTGTGNSGKGCSPSTSNATKYPDGILALDLVTGQVRSFFQTFVNDINDEGDVAAAPVLHQTRVIDECANTDQLAYWMTVPTKDSFVYTAPRGASGLLSTPVGIGLASGDAIASPAALPFTQSQTCGVGSSQFVEQGNDIFVPTFDGNFFDIRQASDGSTAIHWQLLVKSCPSTNPCPLFSAPAVITDLVFFGGGEGNFYAAIIDGQIVFSYGTLGLVASGPAISNSQVYFGSYDGALYCLSLNGL